MNATRVDGTAATPGTTSAEPTLGALVSSASRDLSALVRAEVELAKAEVREDVKHAAKGAGLFGAAGFLGFLASILLSFALVYGLIALDLLPWAAFLVVGVAYLLLAAILGLVGSKQVKRVAPPKRAIAEAKDTVATLKSAGKPTRS